MVALKDCNSSAIKGYGYDAATKTLAIRFGPGKVHHYLDVPPDVFASFEDTESKGKAYALLIRNQYECSPVLDEPQ